MRIPARLQPLLDDGLIDAVIKPLRAGKEAEVYLVESAGEIRCAKVYKAPEHRSFHKLALYREGRAVKSSRLQRAMSKHTSFGKSAEEQTWQTAEADTLFLLHRAGVRVPTPHICTDGVLLMELVCDQDGYVAPRMGDLIFSREDAIYYHNFLIGQVVAMLCAGIVHADLSEYNILLSFDGPVVIDFPQSVSASANNNAQMFLERDVRNLASFFGKFAPELLKTNYAKEMWAHYVKSELTVDLPLTGIYTPPKGTVNLEGVLSVIADAREEAVEKQERKRFNETGIPAKTEEQPRGVYRPRRRW